MPAADVIVVGGGPAGSATAASLASRGVRVALFERATFPRRKPCGDYLNPGCDAALARLGVRDAVAASGARAVRGMHLVAPTGDGVTLPFEQRAGWDLPRRTLDDILLAHAERCGTRVFQGACVVGVARESGRVRVTVTHRPGAAPETYCASLVVGADGLRSAVARIAGSGGAPRRGRYTVGGYLEGLAPLWAGHDPDVGEVHLGTDRYCGVAYLPGGLANVTVAVDRSALRSHHGPIDAWYWASLRAFPALADRLAHAHQVGAVAGSGPLSYWRRSCVADGIVLVGDAAAYVDPLTGQGVYLALRGAELAAAAVLRALGGDGPVRRALAVYERARRELTGVFVISRILQLLAFRPGIAGRVVRRLRAQPELGTALIAAIGNVTRPATVLRPGFIARTLGLV